MKNWRNRKIKNPPESPKPKNVGTSRGRYVSSQSQEEYCIYSGKMITCAGTIIDRITIPNNTPLNRNLYRAKA